VKRKLVKNENRTWFGLDTAGTLFPATLSKNQTSLFRLSCTFYEPIQKSSMQKALEQIIRRFPYFHVELKPGFFWFYFEPMHEKPIVEPDSHYPCMEFHIKKKGNPPFRVRVFRNRLAVEFSHSITDGFGALTFLKALAAEYLSLRGIKIKNWADIFRKEEKPEPEEEEDAFLRYSPKDIPWPTSASSAYHIPGKKTITNKYVITTGIIPLFVLKKKASEHGVTINEYLTALMISSIQDLAIDTKKSAWPPVKPIRVMVPVNLRMLFPSKTMKNFILYVMPEIFPALGHYSFEEILKKTHHYMKIEINQKILSQHISRSVNGSRHYIFRVLPLHVKNLLLSWISWFFGERTYTTSVSNLGLVTMPKKFENAIERFEFYPPPNDRTKINVSMISYKKETFISFGSLLAHRNLERYFFTTLVKAGIHVKIETNENGE